MSSPDWPDAFTLIAGGLVLLAFLLDVLLRFLRWLAHPDGDLAPFVIPGSPLLHSYLLPSHPTALDRHLGPQWAIYCALEPDDAYSLS